MKMQCKLLCDKFNNDTTTNEGVGFIESMLDGNSAHRAGALKAGLRESLLNSAPLPSAPLPSTPLPSPSSIFGPNYNTKAPSKKSRR